MMFTIPYEHHSQHMRRQHWHCLPPLRATVLLSQNQTFKDSSRAHQCIFVIQSCDERRREKGQEDQGREHLPLQAEASQMAEASFGPWHELRDKCSISLSCSVQTQALEGRADSLQDWRDLGQQHAVSCTLITTQNCLS